MYDIAPCLGFLIRHSLVYASEFSPASIILNFGLSVISTRRILEYLNQSVRKRNERILVHFIPVTSSNSEIANFVLLFCSIFSLILVSALNSGRSWKKKIGKRKPDLKLIRLSKVNIKF